MRPLFFFLSRHLSITGPLLCLRFSFLFYLYLWHSLWLCLLRDPLSDPKFLVWVVYATEPRCVRLAASDNPTNAYLWESPAYQALLEAATESCASFLHLLKQHVSAAPHAGGAGGAASSSSPPAAERETNSSGGPGGGGGARPKFLPLQQLTQRTVTRLYSAFSSSTSMSDHIWGLAKMHVAEQMLQRSGTLLAHEVVRTRQERLVAMCVPIEGKQTHSGASRERRGGAERLEGGERKESGSSLPSVEFVPSFRGHCSVSAKTSLDGAKKSRAQLLPAAAFRHVLIAYWRRKPEQGPLLFRVHAFRYVPCRSAYASTRVCAESHSRLRGGHVAFHVGAPLCTSLRARVFFLFSLEVWTFSFCSQSSLCNLSICPGVLRYVDMLLSSYLPFSLRGQ